MTLLLREIVRFLLEAGVWVVTLGLIAGVVAVAGMMVAGRQVDRRVIGAAVVAAAGVAALAHRLPAIVIWEPRIAGRPLPVVWAIVGAAAVTAVAVVRRRNSGA